MRKVRGRFALLCVQFIFHFVLLALHCACLGALACLVWLLLQVQSKHAQIPMLFFSQGRHNMQQSMHCSYIQSQKLAVTGHLNGQHRDQYSRWRHKTTFFRLVDLVPCITCVPTHAQKALNFELWLFKKCKGGIETRIKKQLGNLLHS